MGHREIQPAADSSQPAANIHLNLPAAGCRLHAGAEALSPSEIVLTQFHGVNIEPGPGATRRCGERVTRRDEKQKSVVGRW